MTAERTNETLSVNATITNPDYANLITQEDLAKSVADHLEGLGIHAGNVNIEV